MAVAYDSVGPSGGGGYGVTGSGTTATWTHTTSGASCYLLVAWSPDNCTTSFPGTATCDSVSMTSLGIITSGSGGTTGYLQVFGIAGVAAGAHTVALSISGDTPIDITGGSIAYTGVTAVGTPVTSSTLKTATVPTLSSASMVAGFFASGDTITQAGGVATGRFLNNLRGGAGANTGNIAGADAPGTGSSVVITWTTSSTSFCSFGVELQGGGAAVSAPGQYLVPRRGTFLLPSSRGPLRLAGAPAGAVTPVAVNVTGVAAAVTVAGGAGTPAGGAAVTGVAAPVTVQGGTGTPAGGAGVTGLAAPVTVQGGTGTVAAAANITGIAAPVTVQGGTGAATAGTYRLFPTVNGPSTLADTGYAGDFISAVCFAVKGGGNWFEGYWWWCAPSGQPTTAVKCALWSVQTNAPAGTLVPGSVVTSGTLTAGAWNYIPLSTPIQLAPSFDPSVSTSGSAYVAGIGWTATAGFPDTNGYYGTGGPGVAGITDGPLVAYSGTSGLGGTLPAPLGLSQGLFSVAGNDPSVTFPGSTSNVDNFWADIQITTTPPVGYSGSYRLWPDKYDANAATVGDSPVNYTIATEISLTQTCTLNNVWYYSNAGAGNLATRCDVWNISTGLSVASITSPTWLTPSGGAGAAGDGWLKAAFTGGTTLPAGDYRVSVFNANGTTSGASGWGSTDLTTNYWGEGGTGGVGSSGITFGPLSAPAQPSASGGFLYNSGDPGNTPPYGTTPIAAQPVFGQNPGGTIQFPQLYAPGTGGSVSQNYWIDLEVTPSGTSANVSGVAAPVTVQGGTGTFEGDASVTGLAAPVTVQGGTGTVAGGANVTGIAAPVTVQGGVGAASGSGGVNVTGVAAPVTVQGGTGTPAGGAGVTGVAAHTTVQGGTGTPAGAAGVTGVAAHTTVQGGTGTLSAAAAVTGAAALITVPGGIGVAAGGGARSGGTCTITDFATASVVIGDGLTETVTVGDAATATAGISDQVTDNVSIADAATGTVLIGDRLP